MLARPPYPSMARRMDGCLPSPPQVNSMLARRLEAKFARDYESADAIKEAMRFKHGVTVDDGRKQWCATHPLTRPCPHLAPRLLGVPTAPASRLSHAL